MQAPGLLCVAVVDGTGAPVPWLLPEVIDRLDSSELIGSSGTASITALKRLGPLSGEIIVQRPAATLP